MECLPSVAPFYNQSASRRGDGPQLLMRMRIRLWPLWIKCIVPLYSALMFSNSTLLTFRIDGTVETDNWHIRAQQRFISLRIPVGRHQQSRRCVCASRFVNIRFPTPGCQKWGMRMAYIRCERTGWTLRCPIIYRLCCPYRRKDMSVSTTFPRGTGVPNRASLPHNIS